MAYFKLRLVIVLLFSIIGVKAQSDSSAKAWPEFLQRKAGIVMGYNGVGYQYAELGIALSERGISDRHSYAWVFSASCEMRLDKTNRLAPKLSAWMAQNGGVFGLNLLYYTSNDNDDRGMGSLCFRPELGIGLSLFKLAYGYNFALSNKSFMGVNRHSLNLSFVIGVVKVKEVGEVPWK